MRTKLLTGHERGPGFNFTGWHSGGGLKVVQSQITFSRDLEVGRTPAIFLKRWGRRLTCNQLPLSDHAKHRLENKEDNLKGTNRCFGKYIYSLCFWERSLFTVNMKLQPTLNMPFVYSIQKRNCKNSIEGLMWRGSSNFLESQLNSWQLERVCFQS